VRSPLIPTRAIDGQVIDVDIAGLSSIDLLWLSHCCLSYFLNPFFGVVVW
jgi:hypothetical protein